MDATSGTESDLVDLRTWIDSTCFASSTAVRKISSWNQVVTDYGNTFGAHLSPTVPDVLNEIALYGGPEGTLGGLALRSAAVVAESALFELLPQVGVSVTRAPRLHQPGGATLSRIYVGPSENGDSSYEMTVSVDNPKTGLQIARIPMVAPAVLRVDVGVVASDGTYSLEFDWGQ
jgi:hypothetical protein